MRTVWLLLQAEAARWKNRRNIGFLIVLIIVMISTFCYVKEQEAKEEEVENPKIALGVAKEDTSQYAELLMQYFNENEYFLQYVDLIEAEEAALQTALEEGSLDAYLVIPENFAQSMIDMENLPVKARVSMKNPTKALVLRYVMEAYENYIEAVEVNCTALYRRMKTEGFSYEARNAANVDVSLELIFTALGKDDFYKKRMVETEIQPEEDGVKTLSMMQHYQYTGVYFVLMFLFLPAGLRIIELRRNGIARRLKVVNIPMAGIMTAVGIPYLVLGASMLAVICYRETAMDSLFKAMLLVLPWLPVFLLLGLFCENSQKYLFVCSMLLVCLAVFGGSLIPEEFLPDSFQTVAKWLPNRNFTYVMGGVQP